MMHADERSPKLSGLRTLAILLLPRTLQARLTFLGIFLLLVVEVATAGGAIWLGLVMTYPADAVLIWALVVAIKDRRQKAQAFDPAPDSCHDGWSNNRFLCSCHRCLLWNAGSDVPGYWWQRGPSRLHCPG